MWRRSAGPRLAISASLGAAVLLGGALAISLTKARSTEAMLQARIVQLERRASELQGLIRARRDESACAPAYPLAYARPENAGDRARLLMQSPPGFDACARMETADAAVLTTLGK